MKRETLKLPPGRLIRISDAEVARWRAKVHTSYSRHNKYPICDGPIEERELPPSVAARAAELAAANPWLKARRKHADVTGAQWIAIREFVFERDCWACVYCGELAEHADHVIPITKFGSWHPDNVAAACTSCNCSKGNFLLDEWEGLRG